jgi:hypothetical protein
MTNDKVHDQNIDHEEWLENMDETQQKARVVLFEIWETFRILLDKGITRSIKEIKFFFSNTTFVDYIGGGLSALIGFLATLILATGVFLIGYQIGLWLIDGVWTEFPLFLVFNFLFENTALHTWISNPESMYGLQVVVSWILENTPLSAALIVPGVILGALMTGITVLAVMVRYYQFKNPKGN